MCLKTISYFMLYCEYMYGWIEFPQTTMKSCTKSDFHNTITMNKRSVISWIWYWLPPVASGERYKGCQISSFGLLEEKACCHVLMHAHSDVVLVWSEGACIKWYWHCHVSLVCLVALQSEESESFPNYLDLHFREKWRSYRC